PRAASRSRGRRARVTGAADPFGMLWAERPVRRTFLLWSIAAIALQFGYYGANSWLPSYLVKDLGVNIQSMGWYVAGTYTMMVVGKIITGYLADRLRTPRDVGRLGSAHGNLSAAAHFCRHAGQRGVS